MNSSEPYTLTFDPGPAQLVRKLADQFKTTPTDVIAKALVLLERVQGKTIIIKDQRNTVAIDMNKLVKE